LIALEIFTFVYLTFIFVYLFIGLIAELQKSLSAGL